MVPASILSEKYGRGRVLVVSALGATAQQPSRVRALALLDPPLFARNRTVDAVPALKKCDQFVTREVGIAAGTFHQLRS